MRNTTKGVELLLGDPKKAIVKLALPMMMAMLVQTLYNLADGIWVAGLGPEALSAIGMFFPIFMIIISFAAGIGIGVNAVISQKIGRADKEGADKTGRTSILLVIILSALLTIISLLSIDPALRLMGARDKILELSLDYSKIIIYFIVVFIFNNVGNAILRGEGDAKRAMYAISVGSFLNIFLDPIFIYTFKLGVKGAAYATVISAAVGCFLISYWFFIRKSTYLSMNLSNLEIDLGALRNILKIGIPASFAQISMSVAIFVLNSFATRVGGQFGVAVFTSAWRVINLGTIPMIGASTAVTSVVGAAFGAKDVKKLETAHLFAIRFGFFIGLFLMAAILVFAKQIAFIFTYSESGKVIFPDLVRALMVLSLFLPGTPFGMFTSAMFQGIGHAGKSLAITIFRTIVLQVLFCWLLVNVFEIGLSGVWWGIVIGNLANAVVAFTWSRFVIQKLRVQFSQDLS
ncbi:MAG TPA: MATE family efflux transporter [Pseudothermotoga sp.]|nr:MATE family efflux transporter [Pseudothermotoga sp.]HOK82848.1 MATE family efflux transporter [Pseudothermotoga sp.]HPP69979.1 MATE family efflux transporter [Pseudothermotoga sp.]